MRDIDFDEPVGLLTDKPGKTVQVTTAGRAAEWLLNKWPAKPGPKHLLARQAIVALLEGKVSATEAREAFEHAADEAEIRIGGWHARNPVAMFLAKHRPAAGVPVPRPKKR
jgi:hypothetical protein